MNQHPNHFVGANVFINGVDLGGQIKSIKLPNISPSMRKIYVGRMTGDVVIKDFAKFKQIEIHSLTHGLLHNYLLQDNVRLSCLIATNYGTIKFDTIEVEAEGILKHNTQTYSRGNNSPDEYTLYCKYYKYNSKYGKIIIDNGNNRFIVNDTDIIEDLRSRITA